MNASRKSTKNHANEEEHFAIPDRTFRKSASQCLAALATNLIKFAVGTILGFVSVLIAELYKKNAEIKMSFSELTWFGSYCFMSPVGALLTGILAQNIGARPCLLMSSIMFVISGIIYYFATNSVMLLCAQAINGAITPVAIGPGATYVIEITQPHLRGALMASTNLSIMVGAFSSVLLSNWLHWRTIVLVNLIFPILGFLAMCMVPESPHWLASKGKLAEAEKSLSWLRGWTTSENTSHEFNILKETYKVAEDNSTNRSTNSYKTKFKPYFHRSFYVPLATVSCMFVLHAFTGYVAITGYFMIIFRTIGASLDIHVAGSLYDSMRIIGAVLCVLSIHYTGKRMLIFISLIGAGLLYFLIATFLFLKTKSNYASYTDTFNWIATIAMILSTFFTAAGIDKAVFMYNAELFPTKFRNIGTGTGCFVYAICSSVMSKTFLYLEAAVSLPGTFLLFGISCFVSCLTFYYILPETEGKTLQEIEERYRGTRKNVDIGESKF